MNVFFTCKNTLVILLQLYRLYVVYSENRKTDDKDDFKLTKISIISKPDMYDGRRKKSDARKSRREKSIKKAEKLAIPDDSEYTEDDTFSEVVDHGRKSR